MVVLWQCSIGMQGHLVCERSCGVTVCVHGHVIGVIRSVVDHVVCYCHVPVGGLCKGHVIKLSGT